MNATKKEISIVLFGFIILIIGSIASEIYGVYNLQKMHEITTRITQHPLMVSNAALNFQLDVYKTRHELNNILFSHNQKELDVRIQTIHLSDQSASKNLEIVNNLILGEKGKLLFPKAQKLFDERKKIRDQVIDLVLKNEMDRARAVFNNNEPSYVQLDAMAVKLNIYAKGRAALYQNEANELFAQSEKLRIYIIITLLLFFSGLTYYIVRRIAVFIRTNEQLNSLILVQSRYVVMSQMIGMIAHQWRQPLAVISMDANNIMADIEMGSLDDKILKETSRHILEKTAYLSNTIDDFSNFFLGEKKKEELSMQEVLEETQALLVSSLQNHEIVLEIDNKCSSTIFINKGDLIQVLVNVINNAKDAVFKHTHDQKKITINISEDENEIEMRICDNGGGIDMLNMEKIFDPYFTTKESLNGSGLGLYMSKMIITQHFNGSITAKNQDNGVCFSIRLPKQSIKATS